MLSSNRSGLNNRLDSSSQSTRSSSSGSGTGYQDQLDQKLERLNKALEKAKSTLDQNIDTFHAVLFPSPSRVPQTLTATEKYEQMVNSKRDWQSKLIIKPLQIMDDALKAIETVRDLIGGSPAFNPWTTQERITALENTTKALDTVFNPDSLHENEKMSPQKYQRYAENLKGRSFSGKIFGAAMMAAGVALATLSVLTLVGTLGLGAPLAYGFAAGGAALLLGGFGLFKGSCASSEMAKKQMVAGEKLNRLQPEMGLAVVVATPTAAAVAAAPF